MVLPERFTAPLSKWFLGLGYRVAIMKPGLKYDIRQSGLATTPTEYAAKALMHSIFFFFLFFGLFFVLNYRVTERTPGVSIFLSLVLGFGIGLILLVVLLRYPKIAAGKRAEQINNHLIFALKDLLLQVGAGVSLYNSFVNVSRAGYGLVSEEFERAARSISTGMPMTQALERMAMQSKSDFLKRTIWQLVNTLKAGASVKGALRTIITDLTSEERSKIADYARELNLWALVYMLFAVAIPTIGAVLLVILSSFAGVGISKGMFIAFLAICVMVQYALIGLVKSRRPLVTV
jgi:flagellar protein FlaJ